MRTLWVRSGGLVPSEGLLSGSPDGEDVDDVSSPLWDGTLLSSLQLLGQTTSGPQSSSPALSLRSWAESGVPGPTSPATQSGPDLPVPPDTAHPGQTARTLLVPLILQAQGHSWAPWGLCLPYPRPGPSQDNWAGGQASAVRAGFTAWPAGLPVLQWASCRICPIIWTVGFNSHCVLAQSPANIAGRHPLHASRPLPSRTAHPYSKLKI